MAKSLSQLRAQIAQLQQEAEAMRSQEVEGVVERIREAIAAYELTPEDLFGEGRQGPGRDKRRKKGGAAAKEAGPKFRDANGNTWGGRGPRPRWLREALAGGAALEQFAV